MMSCVKKIKKWLKIPQTTILYGFHTGKPNKPDPPKANLKPPHNFESERKKQHKVNLKNGINGLKKNNRIVKCVQQ